MRDLNECKAEIFRLSENKIKEKKRRYNRIIALCLPLCLILTICTFAVIPLSDQRGKDGINDSCSNENIYLSSTYSQIKDDTGKYPESSGNLNDADNTFRTPASMDPLDDTNFEFSLTWGCYGISSYDSKTERLVKTTDAARPEDYITTYSLTTEQWLKIINCFSELNIESYPDEYDPHGGTLSSDPSMTLTLTVRSGDFSKTVTARDIALTYECEDPKGQKFLDVCKVIRDILTSSDEWKALPEYEFFYD